MVSFGLARFFGFGFLAFVFLVRVFGSLVKSALFSSSFGEGTRAAFGSCETLFWSTVSFVGDPLRRLPAPVSLFFVLMDLFLGSSRSDSSSAAVGLRDFFFFYSRCRKIGKLCWTQPAGRWR